MSRSIFVLEMILLSLFTGFIGMLVGENFVGEPEAWTVSGFLLPTIGLLSCLYYDSSHK